MDIQSYCLPDFPRTNEFISPIIKFHQSKSAKSPRDLSISTKSYSTDNEFLQPNEKQQIIRTLSARKSNRKIILFSEKKILLFFFKLIFLKMQ